MHPDASGPQDRLGTPRSTPLAVPPKPVGRLDRVCARVGTMKEHKQSPKLDRIDRVGIQETVRSSAAE